MADSVIQEYDGHLPIRCLVITQDTQLVAMLRSLWPADQVDWRPFTDPDTALSVLFNDPPVLLVLDARAPGLDYERVVLAVKADNVYSKVGVSLCISPDADLGALDPARLGIDDFFFFPGNVEHCKLAIALALVRLRRSLDTNPLSHLPGNTSIIQRIQGMIDKKADFSLGYADLDHFKAFNDKYGFSRGDEVLMFTARAIASAVREADATFSFVGHVGGDDFIFLLPIDKVEVACQRMVAAFDAIVPSFYDSDDRKRGAILTTDRQGKPQLFPLLSLSIAVIFNRDGLLQHYGEASQLASQIKHLAKKTPGSVYRMDRRDCTNMPCKPSEPDTAPETT